MPITKAVIMAGGAGQRLAPLSDYIPKCYLPIYDKPLLVKQIEWLQMAGVKDIILTINDKFYSIINTIIQNIVFDNINLDIVAEAGIPGIARSLLSLEDKLNEESFFFLFGDEYFDDPLFFKQIGSLGKRVNILGVTSYSNIEQITQGCNLILDEERKQVIELVEKPGVKDIISSWCWNGAAVFEKSIIKEIRRLMENNCVEVTNKILIDAINEFIKKGNKFEYIKDNSNNINLSSLEDYYNAFRLEYEARIR